MACQSLAECIKAKSFAQSYSARLMSIGHRCRWYIEGGQDRSLWNAYSAPSGMGEAMICDKLHVHFNHVPVWHQTQKLAGEAAVPYSIMLLLD